MRRTTSSFLRAVTSRVMSVFSRLLQRHPGSPSLWFTYVDVLLQLGATRAVLQQLMRALAVHPQCSGLWIMAADRLLQQGQLQAARRLLLLALRFCPREASVWTQLLRLEASAVYRLCAARLSKKAVHAAAAEQPAQACTGALSRDEGAIAEEGEEDMLQLPTLSGSSKNNNNSNSVSSSVNKAANMALEERELPVSLQACKLIVSAATERLAGNPSTAAKSISTSGGGEGCNGGSSSKDVDTTMCVTEAARRQPLFESLRWKLMLLEAAQQEVQEQQQRQQQTLACLEGILATAAAAPHAAVLLGPFLSALKAAACSGRSSDDDSSGVCGGTGSWFDSLEVVLDVEGEDAVIELHDALTITTASMTALTRTAGCSCLPMQAALQQEAANTLRHVVSVYPGVRPALALHELLKTICKKGAGSKSKCNNASLLGVLRGLQACSVSAFEGKRLLIAVLEANAISSVVRDLLERISSKGMPQQQQGRAGSPHPPAKRLRIEFSRPAESSDGATSASSSNKEDDALDAQALEVYDYVLEALEDSGLRLDAAGRIPGQRAAAQSLLLKQVLEQLPQVLLLQQQWLEEAIRFLRYRQALLQLLPSDSSGSSSKVACGRTCVYLSDAAALFQQASRVVEDVAGFMQRLSVDCIAAAVADSDESLICRNCPVGTRWCRYA
ncbi:hypothetical protein cyc_00384 [Cyclospora cayetanensis]|uniref:Uncharacterized protein n=1 Tax=Cyclospora cayetanensis TaxID=88456 RepID=A0A1D3CZ70_9EIME|nr:hypothetical protein cyc_00384 [Cyclospora cayetanensis]